MSREQILGCRVDADTYKKFKETAGGDISRLLRQLIQDFIAQDSVNATVYNKSNHNEGCTLPTSNIAGKLAEIHDFCDKCLEASK